MAGRPITSNTRRAQQRREQMRRAREAMKARPLPINTKPLAAVLANWRTS